MIELKIPKLGLTMEKAKLLSWQFNSGDEVKRDQAIFTIETDKVTFEVPSPADGILHPTVPAGEIFPVEHTVGYLAESRQEYEQIIKDFPSEEPPYEKVLAVEGKERKTRPAPSRGDSRSGKRIKASPLARAMASAHGLILSEVKGSGPGGRIVRDDILKALEQTEVIAKRDEYLPGALNKDFIGKEPLETIPITGTRRTISENMCISLSQSAQLTLHTEACAEALIDLRNRLNNRFVNAEVKSSYNAILVKIAATALRLHPKINASVEGNEIKVWQHIHVGVAMESENALVVPVIRNPDLKSIAEINRQLNELIVKTRGNRLLPDDLANGTFTISNLGFADIDWFTPILRPPESALLGVGRIVVKPVVKDGQITPEARIGLSLTFDHRIIDGAPAAKFLKTLKEILEDPVLLLL
jgi:pyruvate dehydrogenase E2 component (dihydrolipoamide acetyltransferase)